MAGADAFQVDFDHVQATGEPAFTVDLDGFEGPLDLLLELARRQRVDLARISILALAEQYLEFVEAARKLRLELAADYLVMAAWLAFLKSRLLLPAPPEPADQDASALAEALARRLRALAAIRKAANSCSTARASAATSSPGASLSRSRRRAARHMRRISTTCWRPTPGRLSGTLSPAFASRRARSGRSPRRARP